MQNDILQGVLGASATFDRTLVRGRRRWRRLAVDAQGGRAGYDHGQRVWSAGTCRTLVRRCDSGTDRQDADCLAVSAVARRRWRFDGSAAQSDGGDGYR